MRYFYNEDILKYGILNILPNFCSLSVQNFDSYDELIYLIINVLALE